MKNFKKNGGFTLVELIVVIAILAILAAVAVPAYSGYIEKANAAGDETLIAAINRAFTSACVSEGIAVSDVKAASIPVDANGKIGGASGASLADATPGAPAYLASVRLFNGTIDASGLNALNASFAAFFAGNEGAAFKTIASSNLVFDPVKGVFVDPASVDTLNIAYGDTFIAVPGAVVEAYKNSNWGDVASSDVLGLVGSVTDFAGAVDNDTFLGLLESEGYLNAAAAALGVSVENYEGAIEGMLADAEAKYRKENPDATDEDIANYRDTVGGQIMANNAVLVAAQNAEANKGAIIGLLTQNDGVGAKAAIGAAMSSDPANGLAQASLAYGLYTSYMLDKNPNYDTTTNPDPLDVMNTLDDPDFQTYLKSDKATTDLDGFVSVLDAAGKNTGNGVGADIVQNGFADNKELQDMMQQILGK